MEEVETGGSGLILNTRRIRNFEKCARSGSTAAKVFRIISLTDGRLLDGTAPTHRQVVRKGIIYVSSCQQP